MARFWIHRLLLLAEPEKAIAPIIERFLKTSRLNFIKMPQVHVSENVLLVPNI